MNYASLPEKSSGEINDISKKTNIYLKRYTMHLQHFAQFVAVRGPRDLLTTRRDSHDLASLIDM